MLLALKGRDKFSRRSATKKDMWRFNLEVHGSLLVASPQRGEMFIAWRPFFTPQLCRSAMAFPAAAKVPLPGFAPNGARSPGARLAINISLLWSENKFNCCTCKFEFTFIDKSVRLFVQSHLDQSTRNTMMKSKPHRSRVAHEA